MCIKNFITPPHNPLSQHPSQHPFYFLLTYLTVVVQFLAISVGSVCTDIDQYPLPPCLEWLLLTNDDPLDRREK